MKLILFLCVSVLVSCQSPRRQEKAGSGKKLVPISVKALQLDTAANPETRVTEVCVKVDSCASGFKTPTAICAVPTLPGRELSIPVGDSSCKLKLLSFEYNFPAEHGFAGGPQRVTLSPDQRDRLADSATGESIQVGAPDSRFSFAIAPGELLPYPIPTSSAVDVSYKIQTTQRGAAVDVHVKDFLGEKYSHFLEVCEDSVGHHSSSGEKTLMLEIKRRTWGVTCRDIAKSLERAPNLVLHDRDPGRKDIDLELIAEFDNLTRFDISGFNVTLSPTVPNIEITFGGNTSLRIPANITSALDLTISGVLDSIHVPPTGLTHRRIAHLRLDHVITSDGQKPITELLGMPDPRNKHWMNDLALVNVVHENYENLGDLAEALNNASPRGTISRLYTNVYDQNVIDGVTVYYPNFESNTSDRPPPEGPADAICLPFITKDACMYAQCVWAENSVAGEKCSKALLDLNGLPRISRGLKYKCEYITDARNCLRRHQCFWDNVQRSCDYRNSGSSAPSQSCCVIKLNWKCERVLDCKWHPHLHPPVCGT